MANSLLRPLAVDGFIAEATSEGWGEAMRLPRLTLIKYVGIDIKSSSLNYSRTDLDLLQGTI